MWREVPDLPPDGRNYFVVEGSPTSARTAYISAIKRALSRARKAGPLISHQTRSFSRASAINLSSSLARRCADKHSDCASAGVQLDSALQTGESFQLKTRPHTPHDCPLAQASLIT